MPNNYVSSHSGPAIDAAVSFVNTMPAPDSSLNGKILVVTESAYNASDFSVVFASNIGSIHLTGYQTPTGTQQAVSQHDTIPTAFKKVQGQINTNKTNISSLQTTVNSAISSIGSLQSTLMSTIQSVSNLNQDVLALDSTTRELSNKIIGIDSNIIAINSNLATMSSTIESVGFTYQAKNDLLILLTNMISEGSFSTTVNSNLQTLKVDLGFV